MNNTIIDNMPNQRKHQFKFMAITSLILIYFLIFIGSFVRSTGSGMGCPDWPKCFGQWIPPTHESQLPPNYQTIYAHRGYKDVQFNVVKTWTEYFNRLAGATIGISTIIVLITAYRGRRWLPPYTLALSAAIVLLVGFQGWLGAVVVASVLTPWVISTHMAVAIVIIVLLNITISRAIPSGKTRSINKLYVGAASGITITQFIIGSQVRQAVDHGITNLSAIGPIFYIHRSLSWAVAIGICAVAINYYRAGFKTIPILLGLSLAIQMVSGIVFSRIGIIALLQPVHLTAAAITIGTLSYAWFSGVRQIAQVQSS